MKLRVVELYESYHENSKLLSYLKGKGIQVETYSFYSQPDKKFKTKHEIILQELGCFVRLVRDFFIFKKERVLCLGGHYSFLILTRLLGSLMSKEYQLFIYNYYLHELGRNFLVRLIIRFLFNSDKITLIVQSQKEVQYYAPLIGKRPHFVPYCSDFDIELDFSFVPSTPFIFSGGYTNRDYALLLQAAVCLPALRFVLVVSSLNVGIRPENAPSNVLVLSDVSVSIFYGLLEKSSGVVVALKHDVGSSGQMLCVAAMHFKKPIVYCDVGAINYYFCEPETAIPYEIGDLRSLLSALRELTEGSVDVTRMVERAFARYQSHYTLERGYERLAGIVTA